MTRNVSILQQEVEQLRAENARLKNALLGQVAVEQGAGTGALPPASTVPEPDGIPTSAVRDHGPREPAAAALRAIVAGTTAIGQAFFTSLVRALAESLSVRYAFIAELPDPGARKARTLALWADGRLDDNVEYDLAGTPCANVVGAQTCFYPDGVAALFPQDQLLAEMGVDSYLGTPLRSSTGEVLGLLVVLHDGPIDDALEPQAILEIFASRAAAELERLRMEEALRASETRFRTLLLNLHVGVIVVGPQAEVLLVNRAACEILGVTEEEWLGRTPFHPEWKIYDEIGILIPPAERLIPRVMATRQPIRNFVAGVDRPDTGERIWLFGDVEPQVTAEGAVTQVISTFTDITETKRQAILMEHTHRAAQVGGWQLELATDTLEWTDETYRIHETTPELYTPTVETALAYFTPEWRPILTRAIDRAMAEGVPFDLEPELITARGNRIVVRVIGKSQMEGERQVRLFGAIQDITKQKTTEQKLKDSLSQMHVLAGHLQSVREEERARIAREVHDELGQTLTGLKMILAGLRRSIVRNCDALSPDTLMAEIAAMNELIEKTIGTVRRIATELRPAVLDTLGLVSALAWQAQDFQKRTGIECSFATNLEHIRLDQERVTAVFRIFQESLTNVWRHARATRVRARLEERGESLILSVRDNGIGIRDEDLSGTKTFGLLSMRERALLLGGTVQIVGEPTKGTTVTIQIPMRAAA